MVAKTGGGSKGSSTALGSSSQHTKTITPPSLSRQAEMRQYFEKQRQRSFEQLLLPRPPAGTGANEAVAVVAGTQGGEPTKSQPVSAVEALETGWRFERVKAA